MQAACDPNNFRSKDPYSFGMVRGPFGVSRNCFGGESLVKMVFDYTFEFFETYKNKRKYFNVRLLEPHEFTGIANKFTDLELANFLNKMESSGHMDNTILQIYSDHGDHINLFLH
jgi:hypothetical protein